MVKRLTLRKLLGYLDDSLEPAKAREIGQRIANEEWARELIERIRSVTRRRRLSAPQATPGPGEMEPNDVAEYLDRVLPPDVWPEVEQQILASDTALAEAACVHQTLTMGQSQAGDISPDGWERAYSIVGVKGHKLRAASAASLSQPEQEFPSYLTQTIPLAVPPAPTPAGLGNRLLMLTLVFLLAVGLGWGVYKTLSPPVVEPASQAAVAAAPTTVARLKEPVETPDVAAPPDQAAEKKSAVEPKGDVEKKQSVEKPAAPAGTAKNAASSFPAEAAPVLIELKIPSEPVTAPPLPEEDHKPMEPALASAAKSPPRDKPPAPPKPALNAPSKKDADAKATTLDESIPLATVSGSTQVLFRRSAGKLERVRPKAFAYLNDELLNPDGYRSKLESIGRSVWELIDQTKIRMLQPRGVDAAFALDEGFVVVESSDKPLSILVERDKILAKIAVSAGGRIGFEAVFDGGPTAEQPTAAPVRTLNILVLRGQAEVSAGAGAESVLAGHQVAVHSDGSTRQTPTIADAVPGARKESPSELRAAQSFAAALPYGERIGLTLRGEMDSRNKEVGKLAVRCMGAVDETAGLAAALGAEKSPEARQTAIIVSRQMLRRRPQLREPFLAALRQHYSEEDADVLLAMILGFSPRSQATIDTYAGLIEQLESDQLALREGAIFNLRDLTGRDFQYSADATISRRKSSFSQWVRWLDDQSAQTLPPRKSR